MRDQKESIGSPRKWKIARNLRLSIGERSMLLMRRRMGMSQTESRGPMSGYQPCVLRQGVVVDEFENQVVALILIEPHKRPEICSGDKRHCAQKENTDD
jgi:hypothetical protein